MKWYHIVLLLAGIALVVVGITSTRDEGQPSGDFFYAITSAGVLSGYSVADTSLVVIDGRPVILLEQTARSLGKLLGMDVDSDIELVYHIDPATGRFLNYAMEVDQGVRSFAAGVRIEEDGAHCTTTYGRGDHVVDLPAGVLLENSVFFGHILADFADPELEEKTYAVFDVNDQAVQDVRYARAGNETIELAGRTYDTVMVDRRNLATGVLIRMWLEQGTGLCTKIVENDGRVIRLAEPALADQLERFDADPYILTRTNLSIPDVTGIGYMKVRAKIRPTGMVVTPASLNVPGQSFDGTVTDNLIEGVFEIEHPRYDGTKAPPFPPDFAGDPALARYLGPSEFIESDDPDIIAKARELTAGAGDAWDAARRLSRWVSREITYAIPGGGSARGVLRMRAGECGGHSVLLAAFCRAVGIPARVVWGVTYVPQEGGLFGQHGWNEIWMGPVGWVPVDATGSEFDFVDSGHLRLGEFESFSTWANSKEYEILEYRVVGATPESMAAAERKYAEYLGEYELAGFPEACPVYVQDGSLVFEIPGKAALAFGDPDDRGHWPCKMASHIYLVFERTDGGEVAAALLHEIHRLPRQDRPDTIDEGVPPAYRPYPGSYLLAQANAEFTVSYGNGGLRMHHPLENRTSSLADPDADGGWVSDNGRHTIRFEQGPDGAVTALSIDAVSRFER